MDLSDKVSDKFQTLVKEVATGVLSIDQYAQVVARAMELVDEIKDITGAEKKEAVLKIVDKIMKNIDIPEDKKNILEIIFSPDSVSTVIETIIMITKKQFHINEKHFNCVGKLASGLVNLCSKK